VCLGKPYPGDESHFQSEVVDGITIWFTNTIKAEKPDETVQIDARKVLFSYDLVVNNAKQYIKKG
jgi:hypothetical protein